MEEGNGDCGGVLGEECCEVDVEDFAVVIGDPGCEGWEGVDVLFFFAPAYGQ